MKELQHPKFPLLVLAGPTAVGKTSLSIHLAQQWNGEVINADSVQVYRGLDIGSGKIKPDEMDGVPHHLLDILDPWDKFDAASFQTLAHQMIVNVVNRGKLPIVVGGTGLYLEGLLYDLEFGNQTSGDPDLRRQLEERANQEGGKSLWEELHRLDPDAAEKIPYQNTRRLVRALEVIHSSGEKFSQQMGHQQQESVYHDLLLICNRPRPELYDRINSRVDQMVAEGLEAEARWLFDQPGDSSLSSKRAIGYKEWLPYFNGTCDLEEVKETIKQNTRRFAKRQLTWFRNRMTKSQWVDLSQVDYFDQVDQLIESHLTQYNKERL